MGPQFKKPENVPKGIKEENSKYNKPISCNK
ncbi:hypothetical protein OOU_Y34scaffold00346g3 [Pyricularia oryzae Y34]|uniref:Uncharacterized protein n=2 Tax=Pyricularia oryzae TaxID=318829 RepID=A0AA97P2N3_PYRO3|nr:hypothetical protein OOU_Y34scaffold00346g3 [Pyricularia oryzae Y34]